MLVGRLVSFSEVFTTRPGIGGPTFMSGGRPISNRSTVGSVDCGGPVGRGGSVTVDKSGVIGGGGEAFVCGSGSEAFSAASSAAASAVAAIESNAHQFHCSSHCHPLPSPS